MSFSDLGWSFSVSTRPSKYKNVDQLLVVRATHRSGFGSKLPRYPADSPNEAMPWMGDGLKGVRGAVETGGIFQKEDGESVDGDGVDIYPGGPDEQTAAETGTVRAREDQYGIPPIDLDDFERWWRANFE